MRIIASLLLYTGCLKSIKYHKSHAALLILVHVLSCLDFLPHRDNVIKYYEIVYARNGKNLCSSIKNSK